MKTPSLLCSRKAASSGIITSRCRSISETNCRYSAMLNAQKHVWAPIWTNPMSLSTRCHQLAMYVVYESPLQMLADNPTHYYNEPACMEFLQHVPAVWDTTIALQAKVGEHILTDRNAQDFKTETIYVTRDTKLPLQLAKGGGWAARLIKE